MSDIIIPGVSNSGIDTRRMIDELVKLERRPIDRMESQVEQYQLQRQAWQDIGRSTAQFRDAARRIYSFESPFNARHARSSNDSVLTATANRTAEETTSEIEVVQIARADRFLSAPVSTRYRVEAGRYEFHVGDHSAAVDFRGGTLQDLAALINRNAGDTVRARVVRDTADTQVIMFEAQHSGQANRLSFLGSALDLALETGIVDRQVDTALEMTIEPSLVRSGEPAERISAADETLLVRSGARAELPRTPGFSVRDTMVLEYEVRVTGRPTDEWTPPPPPPGPSLPNPGGVEREGVRVENIPSQTILPDRPEPVPPPVVEQDQVLFMVSGSERIPLPAQPVTDEFRTVRVPIGEMTESFDGIFVDNPNTHRDIEIRNIRIFDPDLPGEYVPRQPAQIARDAIIRIDGIEVTRSSNEIDDAIAGTTLVLHRASPEPVALSVEPDRETAKDAIIDFVGFYNRLVRDINILTRRDTDIIDQIEYFSEEERQQAMDRLGILQGDMTLSRMRSTLQNMMMNSYPTSLGSELSLLAQIGISTNASGAGSGFDPNRLRGYLEINEAQLDVALQGRFREVKELFGYDSDGDLVIDSGVAFQAEAVTRGYAGSGGVIQTQTDGVASRITRTENTISTYTERLERYEERLRVEYGRMEGAMQSLQESQRALENLNRQTGPQR